MSDKLQAAFKKFGIIHTKSAPGTPQQNSVAEKIQPEPSSKDGHTCLIEGEGVEEHFWGYAVALCQPHPQSSSMQRCRRQSPFSALWFNKSPSLKHHRTFGCKALNLVTQGQPRKVRLTPTRQSGMYLGPDSDHGIHILYNPAILVRSSEAVRCRIY